MDSGLSAHNDLTTVFGIEKMIGVNLWSKFSSHAHSKIGRLHGIVEEMAYRQGKKVYGFGASAKSTVWVNACGIGNWIKCITDTTPQKIGCFSPGSTIPIVPQAKMTEDPPDYSILFAWVYGKEILFKNQEFLENGGQFIVPHPEIQIVGKSEQA